MAGKITDLASPPITPLPVTDLFEIVQNGVNYGARIQDLPQPSPAAGASARRNVSSFSGATIRAKIQSAIDNREPWSIDPGMHTLDGPLDITLGVDGEGAGDGLRNDGGTILRSGLGDDIFIGSYGNRAAQARPAGQNQVTLSKMGLRLRPNGANTRSAHQRCTATGYGIGQCAIVFERNNSTQTEWPTETTQSRSISNAWNTSHGRIHNLTCDVENGSAVDHGCGMFHSQGNTYGSRFYNLDSAGGQSSTRRGAHSLLTIAQPYVHRVTIDVGNDRINTSGTNNFINGQQVMIRTHDATGTQPGGVNFDSVYFVVNRTASNFQISTTSGGGAINITGAGSGFIYAILVGAASAVFSPDEVYIDRISHYNGKMGVSVSNPERLWLGNLTSYAIETILEIPAVLSTAGRSQAISTTIMNIYSESPQLTAGNTNSPAVLVESDGLFVGTFQMRGADSGPQPQAIFRGNDHTISSFDGRSSFAQGGINLQIQATNTTITGQCHTSSTVAVQPDTVGRLRRAGGSGFFFSRNFS